MAACGRCERDLLGDGQCPRCSELDRATAAEAEVRALREALEAFMDDSDPTWPDWLKPSTTGAPDQWLLAARTLAPEPPGRGDAH